METRGTPQPPTKPLRPVERVAAISPYPLSKAWREKIEASVGTRVEFLNAVELRKSGMKDAFFALRRLRVDRLYLPFPEPALETIRPSLEIMGLVSAARRIFVIDSQFKISRLPRTRLPNALLKLLSACFAGALALRRSDFRVKRYLARDLERGLGAPTDRKSVLYLKTNLMLGVSAGGSIGHISGVVNGLLEQGYGVDFVGAEAPVGLRPAARWRPVPLMKHFGMPFEANYYRYHFKVVREALESFDPRNFSFVYQRMSIGNYAGAEIARKWHLPLVIEYNGSEVWVAKHWGTPLRYHAIGARAEEAVLKHAHLVVTVSDVLRDELVEKGIPPERIVSYPNGIDPQIFDPARFPADNRRTLLGNLGIPEDVTLATFVGTFGLWHGTEVLAEVIQKWAERDPDELRRLKLHFLLIGDGLRLTRVKEMLAGAAAPFVTFTGLIEQGKTPGYLAASDILLSPHVPNADGTRFFGSPTKLFEYMAMSKGIVASDLDQIGEVLSPSLRATALPTGDVPLATDLSRSILTTPGSREELEAGIRFLASHPQWRAHLGRRAREAALSNYTWGHHVRAILDGLERVRREDSARV